MNDEVLAIARQRYGGTSREFFHPTKEFLDWMKKSFKGRLIVDCGAGLGQVSQVLHTEGFETLSIDLFPPDEAVRLIIPGNASQFPFSKESVALIARPCHGDWIEATIHQALKTAHCVVYVGFQDKFYEDTDSAAMEERYDVDYLEGFKVGKDMESVIVIKRRENIRNLQKMKTFALVCTGGFYYYWWQWDEKNNKLSNMSGGGHPRSDDDEFKEVVKAKDWEDLDWKRTGYWRPESDTGWLSPTGEFSGCGSRDHDITADLILHKTTGELENLGYVRLYGRGEWTCIKGDPTEEQKANLLKKGYKLGRLSEKTIEIMAPNPLNRPLDGD